MEGGFLKVLEEGKGRIARRARNGRNLRGMGLLKGVGDRSWSERRHDKFLRKTLGIH